MEWKFEDWKDKSRLFYVESYYAVRINDALGEYQFFIPEYDINIFSKLTGIKITEDDYSDG